ncbi:hypothetical protein PIB30_092929 [Stylosanthes scabra]|uniref:Uncharacterized protein n=1 Tax=Stylosanthes scabra TaxID=79078 RepID=A0ABU6XXI0_9FABA|nr:hypothetical protein [Stylosanthes scabra]
MQLAIERQGRDIVEMRKQLNLWTRNTSAREAYTCWAYQQANPNLSEIPVTQIPDIMQTNAEKGRPMFYQCLKSVMGQPLLHKLTHKSRTTKEWDIVSNEEKGINQDFQQVFL